ncbi:hypothetical protein SUGI_0877900 [Cryptomeria japonica]|nr:hypothetical protein SUGI_0877900 [Cryptomeria japonica]
MWGIRGCVLSWEKREIRRPGLSCQRGQPTVEILAGNELFFHKYVLRKTQIFLRQTTGNTQRGARVLDVLGKRRDGN